jgi:hypothetical protein
MNVPGEDLAVLLVHRPGPSRTSLAAALKAVGLQPQLVDTARVALAVLRGNDFAAVITTRDLGTRDNSDFLADVHELTPASIRVLLDGDGIYASSSGELVFDGSVDPTAVADAVARAVGQHPIDKQQALEYAPIEVKRVFDLPEDPDRDDAVTAELNEAPHARWLVELRRIGAGHWTTVDCVGRMLLLYPRQLAPVSDVDLLVRSQIDETNKAYGASVLPKVQREVFARARATTIKMDP